MSNSIDISELFSSSELYGAIGYTVSPQPGDSINLIYQSVAVGASGVNDFDPVDNGVLQWLNNAGTWVDVEPALNITLGGEGEKDLRFIPSAEVSRLSGWESKGRR